VNDPHEAAGATRVSARVLWFSEQYGWGMARDADGRRIMIDHDAIHGEGFRSLWAGQAVEIDVVETPHGPVAGRVVPRGRQAQVIR
jgi:cold shock CspA family protein